ncbi:MAG: tetratricopeptide repeat protein [Acidobacteriota bacterium]
MWRAPISCCLLPGALSFPQPRWSRARLLAASLLLVLLCGPVAARAQSPSFDDLAARAAAARDQHNLPAALDFYAQAVQARPDWQEGWWYLGVIHYSANQYPDAIDAFSHLLALAPHAAPAMALRGLCEFETGDYDGSLRDLEMSVAHGAANQPSNEQILRLHLAELLTRAGRFQDALDQYKALAKNNIEDPDVDVGLGLAGMRLSSLIKDVPEGDRPLFEAAGKAGYVSLKGESQKADAMFQALFDQYPTAPNLHLYYGFLLFPHDPELAIDQFQKELTIAPDNISAHALLAFSLMIAGHYSEAIPEARRVLAAQPDMELAQLALGRSLAETGDVQHATDILNQVLKNDPNNLEAHMGLASIYAREGKREEAYRERMACVQLAQQ